MDLKVRLSHEPDRLNPMLSRQIQSSQVEHRIFLPLADYDPFTLELEPVLMSQHAEEEQIIEGENKGGTRYKIHLREDATWDNGLPVTGFDYLFTYKAAISPYVSESSWKAHFQDIVTISVDSTNPKHLTVETSSYYMLNYPVITSYSIYPAHIYDPQRIFEKYSYEEIKEHEPDTNSDLDRDMKSWATWFEGDSVSRTMVQGCGPYKLVEWIANQQIILEKKEEWWGQDIFPKHPLMEAIPKKITYFPIQDVQTALTSLKAQEIDVVPELNPEHVDELNEYAKATESIQIQSTTIPQYLYLGYNNRDPIMASKAVRNALSRLMDVDLLIEELFHGKAIRSVGPIIPTQPYFNEDLTPLPFDPRAAKELLEADGWFDTDGDGLLDKMLDDERRVLRLNVITSRSQLSQDVCIMLKNEAQKLGISVKIVPDDLRTVLQKVRNGDTQIFALASAQEVGLYDPYNSWHSDNATANGNNLCKFSNEKIDQIIMKLRSTTIADERTALYKRFQEIIHEEQPALFLVCPQTGIACNANVEFQVSRKRPGYFENTFAFKH